MTNIDIISGFLGAGKTTLIRKLLEESPNNEKTVIVENEFGKVGIDSGFLKDTGVEIKELRSGCICCSLAGNFFYSLKEVMEKFQPERIIIEPSGVGKLSDIVAAVLDMKERGEEIELNILIAVVNAERMTKQLRSFGEFFADQIGHAATIVLSRTQNMEEAAINECVQKVKELNPKAAVITTPWDQISAEQILSACDRQEEMTEALLQACIADHAEHLWEHEHEHEEHEHEGHDHHHHHHHADEVFTSWGEQTPHKYTKEKLESILKCLRDTEDYGEILRAKGMVEAEDGSWIYFDMVPGEYQIRPGSPEATGMLCVIGIGLDEAGLNRLFELSIS